MPGHIQFFFYEIIFKLYVEIFLIYIPIYIFPSIRIMFEMFLTKLLHAQDIVGLLCIVFLLVCASLFTHVYCYAMCVLLNCGMVATSQYPEGPTTGHLDTGFSWFPWIHKRMLRWFPRLQVATICFSCSPPDLNFLDP
jgi:hypothetical protein